MSPIPRIIPIIPIPSRNPASAKVLASIKALL
jgi:hypothetical protein